MNLEIEGFDVFEANNGVECLEKVRLAMPDVVVLDVMMPEMDGFEALRELRRFSTVPVIMLTVKADERDVARGLELGADDYVAKPFSRPELLARIEAVLRRRRREAAAPAEGAPLSFGSLTIDVARREATLAGTPLHLTTREFDLLTYMAASPGRIFTREQLLASVWGYDFGGDDRTVDVHVSWLRGKLREGNDHNWFRTVRGVGYAFAPPR
jgi:two-component system response regulator VicR